MKMLVYVFTSQSYAFFGELCNNLLKSEYTNATADYPALEVGRDNPQRIGVGRLGSVEGSA